MVERDSGSDRHGGNFDLIVVGSGIAGQVAALSAVEHGLSVLLLEKTDRLGGSSAMSGGWFAFSGTDEQAAKGVRDSRGQFFDDLLSVGNQENDVALVETFLTYQSDTYNWLKGHGAKFGELSISSGQSISRSHLTAITTLLSNLQDRFLEGGGDTRLEHRVTRLTRDPDGRVSGVVVELPDGGCEFRARAGVVLATGGFSRGTDLLKIFAPEQLAAMPYGATGNTGDGLRMAWKLGAGLADMSHVSGSYGSHPETGEDFHELLTAYYLGAVVVNQAGRRFTDESQDYKTLGAEVLKQSGGLGIQIFDSRVRAMSRPGVPLKDIDALEDIGHVHRARSLRELAEIVRIPPEALQETIDRYNEVVSGIRSDELGRKSLCNGVGDLILIDAPPFFAYPARTLLTTTYCGITINPQGLVTDVDGAVIDGLFAAGEVTGGFHGAAYMTGTSLSKGAVFGRVIAQTAASQIDA